MSFAGVSQVQTPAKYFQTLFMSGPLVFATMCVFANIWPSSQVAVFSFCRSGKVAVLAAAVMNLAVLTNPRYYNNLGMWSGIGSIFEVMAKLSRISDLTVQDGYSPLELTRLKSD